MNVKGLVKDVCRSVVTIIKGRTDVIEIDAKLQITNQIAARVRKLRELNAEPQLTNTPLTPLTAIEQTDLTQAVHDARISHQINERRQRLNS